MARIGFIGLGRMGLPMLRNLLNAGHAVQAFDLSEATLGEAREAGAAVAASGPEAADGVEVLISMVPTGRHVLDIHTGPGGLSPGCRRTPC